jgi:mycothiol synthase
MTMSPFGIVTRDRKPKRALATVQGCFWARHPVPALFMRRADLKNLPEVILPPDCLLREGSAADFDGLADLLRRAFGDARWTLERVHTTFQEDPSVLRILVVERQGQVVATASVRLLPEEFPGSGYVHWVAADPKLPGMGLGYQVSLATLHEFAALGCQDAVLETNDFRLPAVNTYLKLGFQPEDRHESHTTRWKNLLSLIQTAREQRK